MNISLENYLRDKLHKAEENLDYAVATESVRAWLDVYKAEKDNCAGSANKSLFDHLSQEYGLNLTESELADIERIVYSESVDFVQIMPHAR